MAGRKSTQKPQGNTKLEPSEIFAAVGMMMKEKAMQDLCNDDGNKIMAWLTDPKAGLELSKGVVIQGNRTKYAGFLKFLQMEVHPTRELKELKML